MVYNKMGDGEKLQRLKKCILKIAASLSGGKMCFSFVLRGMDIIATNISPSGTVQNI